MYNDILLAENQDSSSVSFDAFFEKEKHLFNEEQAEVIKIIGDRPDLVKPSGKINVRQLSKEFGCCPSKARKLLKEIQTKINLDL